MNKLLTFDGRMPIWQDDLDYMNGIVRDSFIQLLEGLADVEKPNIILSGCTVEDGNITEGVVVLDGEILPCRSRQGDEIHGFYIAVSMAGSRVFKDGVSHDCYEIREAIPAVTQSEATTYPIGQCLRLGELLSKRVHPSVLVGPHGTSTGSYISAAVVLKKMGPDYYVRGYFRISAGTTVGMIWTNNQFIPDDDLSAMSLPLETLIPVTVSSSGVLSVVPGKIEIQRNPINTSFYIITVSLPDVPLEAGAEGQFSAILNTPLK